LTCNYLDKRIRANIEEMNNEAVLGGF